jgi:hypothetical protein
MNPAPLPRGSLKNRCYCLFQARVGIGDDELNTA